MNSLIKIQNSKTSDHGVSIIDLSLKTEIICVLFPHQLRNAMIFIIGFF